MGCQGLEWQLVELKLSNKKIGGLLLIGYMLSQL